MQTGVQASSSAGNVRFHAAYVWMICSAAALGGLLFGYDWVVIGGAKPFYEKYFRLESQELVGWANSCALVATHSSPKTLLDHKADRQRRGAEIDGCPP